MDIKTILITPEIKKSISLIIGQAIQYEKLTGRKLGITGEIGEVLICNKLGLKLLANSLSSGFDAIDEQMTRYQIKARRTLNSRGRIGSFSMHEFDYAILGILDSNYNILELYKAKYERVKPLIDKYKKHNPPLREFKNVAQKLKL